MFSKIFLISLIFIFLTPQNNYAEVQKMLKIFGKVLDSDLKDAEFDENCTQTCFSDSDCILAFFDINSNCQLFFYNSTETLQVEETNRDDGFFVAFKTNLSTTNPDFCPIESEISPIILLGGDPISWTNPSDSTWLFKKCIGNWKMFKRPDPEIIVCMQVFLIRLGTTQPEAKDYCTSRGWKVTGVASVEETIWILELLNVTKLDTYKGIWIDGEKETTSDNFEWTDGYTEGYGAFENNNAELSGVSTTNGPENCLVVSRTKSNNRRLNDITCGKGSEWEWGVACGYKME